MKSFPTRCVYLYIDSPESYKTFGGIAGDRINNDFGIHLVRVNDRHILDISRTYSYSYYMLVNYFDIEKINFDINSVENNIPENNNAIIFAHNTVRQFTFENKSVLDFTFKLDTPIIINLE